MMARAGYVAALLLAAPAFALPACGDDESSRSSTASTDGAKEQQGASRADAGATGASGATGSTGTHPKRTPKPNPGPSGGAAAPSPAGTEPTPETPSGPEKKRPQPKPEPEGARYPKSVGRELAKQARVVCSVLPIDQLVDEYQPKSRNPDDVGVAYAARYPVSVRDAVAAGCAEGVRKAQRAAR